MPQQFKGKLLKLTTQKKRLPNGHIAQLEIVQHPGAVLIVPFLDSNRLVLIRQFRPVLGLYLYELPAGTLNPNEKLLSCAHRELIEETGYSARKMIRVGKIFPVPGYSTEVITIFKAEGLSPQPLRPKDPDEVISVRVFSRTEIKKIFRNGRINDAKTICALSFCGIFG